MIDRENLKKEFNKLRLEQSRISSKLKRINWALSSTSDDLAELYLRDDVYVSTKTPIKGIVHVLFDLKNNIVYLVEGRSIYTGILRLKNTLSYEDYIKLEEDQIKQNQIKNNTL